MTKTNRLGWLARTSFAAFLSLGLIACSDDGPVDPPDIDAMQAEPDACVGHECDGSGVATLPEGGTLRVEYLHVGNMPDGTRVEAPMRAFVVQFENQVAYDSAVENSPRPFLGPTVATSPSMTCYDQTAYNLFFNAYHPNIQDFVSSRTYYQGGPASMTMTAAGGPSDGATVDLIRADNAADPADGVTHGNIWQNQGPATELARGAKHSIAPEPSDSDYPGLLAVSGYDIPAGGAEWEGELGAFVAPDFTLDAPTEQEFYGGLSIDRTNDLTMGFTLLDPATIPADWPTPLWFAGFVSLQDYGDGAGTKPTLQYLCLGESGRDTTNAELVVPQAVFDAPNFPESGKFITGIITHTAWAMNETHRFDAVAMNCDIGDFSLTPAP